MVVGTVGGMVQLVLGVEHPVGGVEPAVGAHRRGTVVRLLMVGAVGGILAMQGLVGAVARGILRGRSPGQHQDGEGREYEFLYLGLLVPYRCWCARSWPWRAAKRAVLAGNGCL